MGAFPRKLRRRIRPYVSRPLIWLAGRIVPHLYMAYMKLVFRTSRVEASGMDALHDLIDEHDGAVALVWHEELLTAVYAYPHLGFRPSTLASTSDAGEVITRILQRMPYDVFRGGSYREKSGQTTSVIEPMIEHMRENPGVFYGLTVDGPRGPAYRVKRGGAVIALECGKPLVVQRTWHRRYFRLNSWDRMAIPLPFNVIRLDMKGPYFVPDYARTAEGMEHFVSQVEAELIDLAVASYERFGQSPPDALVKRDVTLPDPENSAIVSS